MALIGPQRGGAEGERSLVEGDWRTAWLPSLVLLGLVLPLYYLSGIDELLLYLAPLQLLPTYGTAWLLTAAIAVPLGIAFTLLLRLLSIIPGLRLVHAAATFVVLGAVVAAGIATILYALLVWVRSFGFLTSTPLIWKLSALSLVLAALAMFGQRRHEYVSRLAQPARVGTLLGVLAALSIPFFQWGAPPAAAHVAAATLSGRPNILLLSIDALSAQHMSLYGAARDTAPELSAFAAGAVTFEHAYANGNFTTAGVGSLITGERPWQHRSLQLPLYPRAAARLDSLPAVLSRAGYQMGYAASNPHAGATKNGLGGYFQFASPDGVEGVQICSDRLAKYMRFVCAAAQVHLFADLTALVAALPSSDNREMNPDLATAPALKWLAGTSRERPVFLWVHLLPPHSPYAAPKPWLGMYDSSPLARNSSNSEAGWLYLLRRMPQDKQHALEARYDESVRYVDHFAGQFLKDALKQLGPNTVVVVTADHGESFAHGYGAHAGPELFDELIHIPLIVKLPNQTSGTRAAQLAEQVDVAPTLATFAGAPIPRAWEGHALFDAAGEPAPDSPVFAMNFEENARCGALHTGTVAVREGRWKLMHFMGPLHYALMPSKDDRLYDLQADPGETKDRSAAEPAEAAHLEGLIGRQLARYGTALPTSWTRGCDMQSRGEAPATLSADTR